MAIFIGPAGMDDELGVWSAPRPPNSEAAALESALAGPIDAASSDEGLWQVTLPIDRRLAARALDEAESRLALAEVALPRAVARLDSFMAFGGPSPAFTAALQTPELELASWSALFSPLESTIVGERSQTAIGELTSSPEFLESSQGAENLFERVRASAATYTLVDTRLGDTRAALTIVSWTGDVRTVWAIGLSSDDAQNHVRAFQLALRTRDTWLRLALTVVRAAVQLTALFATAPLLAVPAAYRFIRQIIAQVQTLQGLPAVT